MSALELPQPVGPLREARIKLLQLIDDPQLLLLPIETIDLLLIEIEEYNDARLEETKGELKR